MEWRFTRMLRVFSLPCSSFSSLLFVWVHKRPDRKDNSGRAVLVVQLDNSTLNSSRSCQLTSFKKVISSYCDFRAKRFSLLGWIFSWPLLLGPNEKFPSDEDHTYFCQLLWALRACYFVLTQTKTQRNFRVRETSQVRDKGSGTNKFSAQSRFPFSDADDEPLQTTARKKLAW